MQSSSLAGLNPWVCYRVHKFFVDENLPPHLAGALSAVHRKDRFRSAEAESLRGVYDVALFGELQLRDFDGIITLDKAQIDNVEERDGLRAAGLHWVGLQQPPGSGITVYSKLTSMALLGLPHLLSSWPAAPHLFLVSSNSVEGGALRIEAL